VAVSWHITVKPENGERFDDAVTFGVMDEVEHLAKQFDLGSRLRTRRPEAGTAIHEYERGTVKVVRENFQTRKKRYGVVNRSTGLRV
jgi:hypothetical protein